MSGLQPESRASRAGPLLVVVVTAAVYAATIFSSFHFDDYAILADPAVTSRHEWWRVFRLEQTRPLTYLTFWMNYQVGGADSRGYHVVNLALHLAAIVLAWRVLQVLAAGGGELTAEAQRRREWVALVAAGIFGLHPLQTEAVAYVFARATLLATLFCLLAWRDWLDGRRWRAVAWFVLGLLSKEECAAFPAFVWLIDWAHGWWRRRSWAPLMAMATAASAAGVRLLYAAGHVKGSGIAGAAGISPLAYVTSQPRVIWRYLRLWLVPVGQNFDHDIQAGLSVAAAIGLAVVLAVAIRQVRRGGVWFLGVMVLLMPTSSIVPLADLMFEHRMYLPMISLALLGAILLERLPRPVSAAVLVILAIATWSRSRVWTNDETLWSDAAAKSPQKVRPKLQLARAVAQKDPQRAEALLDQARRLEPANPETYTQMGSLLLDQRDPYGALQEFDQALRLQPKSADAHSNRGTALFLLGRLGEAEMEFSEALRVDACHRNARHNLALVYKTRGEERRALEVEAAPEHCGAANERE